MSAERNFFLNDIGEVTVRKRRNTKRLSIKIDGRGEVRMTIPFLVSYREATRFLEEKKDWVIRTRKKITERSVPSLFGEGEIMVTKYHRILVECKDVETPAFRISNDITLVEVPPVFPLSDDRIQIFIRKAVEETLRLEAKAILIPRALKLSEKYGFPVNQIRVKNLKSRWGSCSSLNNINLNIHLMRLPVHLSDYVILHELVHIRHRNHSAAFWDELGRHVPDPGALARELRKYHTQVP